ncbi:MAG: acyl transferase domain-containing protein/thioesterase domain-containing protein [Neolewinella sp.]|jgi:acyl transferase domain-containing protein/thioesterase domain-containing protein
MSTGDSNTAAATPDPGQDDIAIIGMAGRFPGASDVTEYWKNLVDGVESIRRLSKEELLHAGVPKRDMDSPDYIPACPVLADIDKFDAAFFGISPRDASVMDPAHRLFLEVTWQALENSGNTGLASEGRVGVFAGSGAPLYWMNNIRSHREISESMGEFLVRHTGNDMNFLATRASYDLDLRGPSINVQTACSSALVAVHLARQSLLANECDMALIGGSTVVLPNGQGYHYKEGEILSPDGHCRPFDHRSAGTVFGSGSACVVLKRLTDALDNGDSIVAVIKGSAVNNDGAIKAGFLAPGVDGQADVIRAALQCAGVSARSISYVEGHGTGTSVGDPIELTALEQAFSADTQDKQFCGIGSVKSNIGHLGEAAGVASLIKVALALQHRTIPPTLGYELPNPRFAMDDSPFHVIAKRTPWQGADPLRAGITALGAGGTNCHLVLEEAPPLLPGEGGRDRHLFVLSARTKTALDQMSKNLAAHISQHPDCDLGDVAYTLAMGRRSLAHRRAVVATTASEAVGLLNGENPTRVATVAADASDPGIVFTFPGGGAQYARMCFDLHQSEPAFRDALEECLAIVDQECGPEVRDLLFTETLDPEAAIKKLQQPSLALPALFSIEYSLARLFESWDVRAVAYIGHSMGEYVAACLAGVFSLRDGLRLVALRGKLFEQTEAGRMAGISLPEAEVRALMPEGLSIAAVNAPDLCVASGSRDLIESLTSKLTEQDIDWTPIHIDVAAHSLLLESILEEFRVFCRTINFRAPETPIASNLTGKWLTPSQAQDPEYWVRHLRGTVRFADCVETVLKNGSHVFLEIGPGRTLTTLVGAQNTKVQHAFNSVRHPREAANDVDYALLTLGKVWAAGAECDWTALYDEQLRNRVPLPGYPFEAQSYWVEARAPKADEATEPQKRESIDDWFSTVAWALKPRVPPTEPPASRWLIISDDAKRGQELASALALQTTDIAEVIIANHGNRFRMIPGEAIEVPPGDAEGYQQVLEQLRSHDRTPEHIVMLLSGSGSTNPAGSNARPGGTIEHSFLAPTRFAYAMSNVLESARLTLVTQNAFSVAGEPIDPAARLSVGPALVVPRELPDFPTRLVDLNAHAHGSTSEAIAALARELLADDAPSIVALRTPKRWTPQLRPTQLPPANAQPLWLADGDVVLITGGLGGMGRVLARHFAEQRKVRLALLSRTAMPERSEWQGLLADPGTSNRLRDRIEWVISLETSGTEVMVVQGDVTDLDSLHLALKSVRATFGKLQAVIHAAGIMDDAPLQSKSVAQMLNVLAPKFDGTLNLDAAIDEDLSAFVVMSSVASFLGLPGQIDYTAANAFLDAFAEDRQRRKPGRTIAINWNAWRDVGMIVGTGSSPPPLPNGRTDHPWLDAWEPIPDGRRYHTNFAIASHWLLGEHRIEGAQALIPGTGFVELARAAFLEAGHQALTHPASNALQLSQVTFLQPFQVAPGAETRLQIEIRQHADGSSVQMHSANGTVLHMTAEMQRCSMEQDRVDLAALRGHCPQQVATRDGFLDQDFVHFGPRWRNLKSIRYGTGQAVIDLELDTTFETDLGTLAYHPALLDMATGAAQGLIPGFDQNSDFLVPFGYDRIRIAAPITRRCTSHVQLRAESSRDAASFDIRIFDETGLACIAIEGFTMKRVDNNSGITSGADEAANGTNVDKPNAATEALLREAITPTEGLVAFDRVMTQTEADQVVASSVDLDVWHRKLALEAARLGGGEAEEDAPSFSRPALASDYTPALPGLESELAAIWSKLLGVSDIGAQDDFFELGGNSLIAVRFFTRVRKEFGISIPLSSLFQAPTIRQLHAVMVAEGYVESQPECSEAEAQDLTSVREAATENATDDSSQHHVSPPILIRPGTDATPIFFVHDGLGEVLLYRSLALLLDPNHPIYGLEPELAQGRVLHTTINAMAKAKVDRIRTVQPTGPYLLAGLCAGGVIAFETARQLEEAGDEVLFVGLIDAAAVGAEERSMRETKERLERIRGLFRPEPGASTLGHWIGVLPKLASKAKGWLTYAISSRLERRRNTRKVSELRVDSPEQAVAGSELPYLQLYEVAHREHALQGVFRGSSVVLFRATQGNGEQSDTPFREIYADDLLGWQRHVQTIVHVVDVPGGHSSTLQEPHVGELAKSMQTKLRSVLVSRAK